MMPKHKRIIVMAGFCMAIMMTICGVYAWQSVPMMAFRPVRMNEQQRLIISNEKLDEASADRVAAVLQEYGETFRRAAGGTVLITPSLRSDTELMWNYTTKASL